MECMSGEYPPISDEASKRASETHAQLSRLIRTSQNLANVPGVVLTYTVEYGSHALCQTSILDMTMSASRSESER